MNGKTDPQHYQDQRAFYLHRKHLASAIEKARACDPKAQELKDMAEERERQAVA